MIEGGQLHGLEQMTQNGLGESDFGRMREAEDFDSATKSSSENHEVGSGDDQDGHQQRPNKKKRYHRHTQHQIQQMEA